MSVNGGPDIITDGLVLYLDAASNKSYPDPKTGTTWYDNINSYNCTLSATEVSYINENDGVLYFDTGISTINGPSTPNAFTTFTGFKRIGTQTDTFHVITGGQTHEISVQSTASLRVGTYTSTRTTLDTSSGSSGINLLNGNWHIISSRYDGSTLKAYINGNEINSVGKSGTTNDSFKLSKIGCWENNGYQANAYIPFIIMYDKALDNNEIKQNYRVLKSRFGL